MASGATTPGSRPLAPVEPVEQLLGAPGSSAPSPFASQLVEGSTPVTTGPVCGAVVGSWESVFAMFWPLCRLRLLPSGRTPLAVPPVTVVGSTGCGGTVTVSVGCAGGGGGGGGGR